MGYSVAIRTLGTSIESLERELISLHSQTVLPDAIIIYIASGYKKPDLRVGMERYVEVQKGMVAQRALDYRDISSEYIFLLDDDVTFAPDSAEILLRQLEESDADCIAADTFANHTMSFLSKARAAVSNLVFPHFGHKWAFKIHSNGSFSYINNPADGVYKSQSAAGPASLWRKSALTAIRLEDELWLDRFGFAYGEDDIEFYKLHINGGKLMVSFSSGVVNLDSKSSSASFQKNPKKLLVRSMSNLVRWHRMQYLPRKTMGRMLASLNFGVKEAWLCMVHLALSVVVFDRTPIKCFLAGIRDGISFIRSNEYKYLPKYKNENFILR